MKHLTNIELSAFLQDYKENSTITILEEGKEKNEIFEVAKARGILLKDSKDLAGFKNVYAFTDKANRNGAILPKAKLLKALPTLVGKPIDIDHKRRYVVGFYIDYRYIHKENKVIAYGIFFKNSFAQEWSTVRELFKKKKLATSFEIWSPKDKYKYHEDGTYELAEMEVAGGAILFETEPAFKHTMVLELAKKQKVISRDLVFASYQDEELITAENVVTELNSKILCGYCSKEFLPKDVLALEHKCDHCFAIVDKKGDVLYPPQIIDFTLRCTGCKSSNWRILESANEITHLKCLSCGKHYEVEFKTNKSAVEISDFTFLYEGKQSCPQCGQIIYFNQSSKMKMANLKCSRCEMSFSIDIKSKYQRRIKTIKHLPQRSIEEQNQAVFAIYKEDLKGKDIELSKKLSFKSRKALSDDMFAIVKTEKTKTGKTRKIRMFPIHDEVHVRNALARLGQEKVLQTIRDMGLTKTMVFNKVIKRAKELNMTKLLKRYEESSRNGQGKGKNKVGDGGINICVCPKCGYTKKHVKGTPCITSKCPKCGVILIGKKNTSSMTKASKEDDMEKAKIKNGIKKLATSYLKLKKELEQAKLEIASKKDNSRLRKVLMIAKELKGQLKEVRDGSILAEQELAFVREENIEKDKELEKASKSLALYKDNAKKIIERRESLGEEFSKDMSDEQILNDKEFEVAQLKAENAKLRESQKLETASDSVGDAPEKSNEYYKDIQNRINAQAFKHN